MVDLRDPKLYARDHDVDSRLLEEEIRLTDPAVRKWERGVLRALRSALKLGKEQPEDWLLDHVSRFPEPTGSYPAMGYSLEEDWQSVANSASQWNQVAAREEGRIDAPTTLGRIDAQLARHIVARAYLNTFLASLFLAPLKQGELEHVASLSVRLDRIIPDSVH